MNFTPNSTGAPEVLQLVAAMERPVAEVERDLVAHESQYGVDVATVESVDETLSDFLDAYRHEATVPARDGSLKSRSAPRAEGVRVHVGTPTRGGHDGGSA